MNDKLKPNQEKKMTQPVWTLTDKDKIKKT